MQHRITERGLLLEPNGTLREPGWATSPLLDFNRFSVREKNSRIKEWDYYLVNDGDYAVALTMCNAGYIGFTSVTVADLRSKREKTATELIALPKDRITLPTTSDRGISFFENRRVKMIFECTGDKRIIDVLMKRFDGRKSFIAHIELDSFPQDSLVVNTPWSDRKTAFHYSRNVTGMRAKGDICVGTRVHHFDGLESFGLLNWGRGVWTYDNRWFWGAGQGRQDGHVVGFNIGYGFGDTTAASHNAFFLDGVCHKLDKVDFGIPIKTDGSYDLASPWHMTSNDKRFTMDFVPEIEHREKIDMAVLLIDQHKIFGKISGTVVLDDGSEFTIRDMTAGAEIMHSRY